MDGEYDSNTQRIVAGLLQIVIEIVADSNDFFDALMGAHLYVTQITACTISKLTTILL